MRVKYKTWKGVEVFGTVTIHEKTFDQGTMFEHTAYRWRFESDAKDEVAGSTYYRDRDGCRADIKKHYTILEDDK